MRSIQLPLSGTGAPSVIAAGTVPVWKCPNGAHGGGVTIQEAYAFGGAGTVSVTVIDMGTAGTAAVGTICALAVAQAAAGFAGSASGIDYFLGAGKWVGMQIAAAGTVAQPAGGYLLATPGR